MERVMSITAKAQEIGKARIYQGMSIRDVAVKAGISVAAVSRMERGAAQSVRPTSAQKLCIALGKEFDDLFVIDPGTVSAQDGPQA